MSSRQSLEVWIRDHAFAVDTLDPHSPLDDLEPLREMVGGARVVAVGESAHHVREFYLLRHRLLRFLVERCGFTTYAFEAPAVESRAVDAWIGGGPGTVEEAVATTGPALGRCREMYDALAWMRAHNQSAAPPLRFAGVVPGAGSGGSPAPELSEVAAYLRRADPDALPLLDRALGAAKAYHDPSVAATFNAFAAMGGPERDAMTAALSRLLSRMESMRAHQRVLGQVREHDAAHAHLRAAWHLNHFHRDLTGHGIAVGSTSLDAAMAEAVLRLLQEGGPRTRIVLALHNVHIRKTPVAHDGPAGILPAGHRLADALGDDYLAIAATGNRGRTVRGQVDPQRPSGFAFQDHPLLPPADGSIEAAFPAEAALTIADLRVARPHVHDADSFRRMRMESYFTDAPVLDSFDAIAYIPSTTTTDYVREDL